VALASDGVGTDLRILGVSPERSSWGSWAALNRTPAQQMEGPPEDDNVGGASVACLGSVEEGGNETKTRWGQGDGDVW
jgi:hypothetical protein